MSSITTSTVAKHLVVLGCSATKIQTNGALPAITLYDGPTFRVLRAFLRDYRWPPSLSVAVFSAKYGMIGGLSHIAPYDQRMTPQQAMHLASTVTRTLQKWGPAHARIDLVLGQDYLRGIDPHFFSVSTPPMEVVTGPIGMKLHRLHQMLHTMGSGRKAAVPSLPRLPRLLYFLPDWDDFLDVDFDFEHDQFSSRARATRHEEHSITLMRPQRLCDGVLVSLAQHLGSKGMLKRVGLVTTDALAPGHVPAPCG